MKKRKWLLMLLLLLALTSCGKQKEDEQSGHVSEETVKQIEHQVKEETEPVATPGVTGENESDALTGNPTGTASTENGSTQDGQNENTETGSGSENSGISDAKDGEFEETNDTVYVIASKVNLRSGPSTEDEIVGKAVYGDSFTRLAKGNKGWDKLLYEGQVVYAYAEFLSTEKVVSIKEQMTVKELLAEAKKKLRL